MNSNDSSESRLRDVLRDDLRHSTHLNARQKDWKELQEFYLSEGQKERLKTKKPVERFFWTCWWILKSMFLKLSPFRRLLVACAVVLVLASQSPNVDKDTISVSNKIPAILLIIVIMLELKDKLLAKDELEAGRKIQKALMPEQSPDIDGWQILLFTQPANDVGGDLVDFLRIGAQCIGISLADISGKGLHAALLMAKLQATIRALATGELSLEKLVSRVNEIFHRDTPASMFASLIYAEITPSMDEIRFVNAGHFPPLLFLNGEMTETKKGSLAIGLKADAVYAVTSVHLKSGDLFIGYSDGIIEARNESGGFYGLERLKSLLPAHRNSSAEQIGKQILEDVRRFVGDASASDDMSLVILKRQ
jgi:hypothetical protein